MEELRGFRSWLTTSTDDRPPQVGAAFASACAERLLASTTTMLAPELERLARSAVDLAWLAAAGGPVEDSRLRGAAGRLSDSAVALGEEADPLVVSSLSLAAYAATAAAGAEPKAVDWASQVVFDVLDTATQDESPAGGMDAAAREADFAAFWAHPLVCVEVERERRDLADLLARGIRPEGIAELRRRAMKEPMLG
jgi:hypothetical protein